MISCKNRRYGVFRIKPLLSLAMLVASLLIGCARTEDRLREIFVEHSDLFDPFSIQFRNITTNGEDVWCGEVNTKNKMGAYIGWRQFRVMEGNERTSVSIWTDPTKYIRDHAELAEMINESMESFCNTIADKSAGKWAFSIPFLQPNPKVSSLAQLSRARDVCMNEDDQTICLACMKRHGFTWDGYEWSTE